VTLQPVLVTHLAGNGTTKSRLVQVEPSAELTKEVKAHFSGARVKKDLWTDNPLNPFGIMSFLPTLKRMVYRSMSDILDDKKLLQQLEAEKFDVVITELFDFIGLGRLCHHTHPDTEYA
ncbi:hypothetical protein COOONC_16498, partial [Cooperia oncophora]